MIHRYFATTLGIIITSLLFFAVVESQNPRPTADRRRLLFILVCLQGALGALTVTLLLKPLIVTGASIGRPHHVGNPVWLSLTAAAARAPGTRMGNCANFALMALAALLLQIALGGWTSSNYAAVACPDFPTCQQSWWPPMDFRDAFVLWARPRHRLHRRGAGEPCAGRHSCHPSIGALIAGSI